MNQESLNRKKGCARWGVCMAVLLALVAGGSAARAQLIVRQVSLAEITQSAGVIVHGRVVELHREGHPDYRNVPTLLVTLEVLENIRGAGGERFSFRLYLEEIEVESAQPGEAPKPVGKYSQHGYAVGQELVLFLYPNSRYGLTSPVGAGQGRFRVLRDREGRRTVVNGFGNRGLFLDVADVAKRAGLGLSPAESRLMAQRAGPVELKGFVELVRRLAVLRVEP